MTAPSLGTHRHAVPAGRTARLPWALAVATVLAQIAYPLTRGESLRQLTVATVVLFFLASLTHAWTVRGARWALAFLAVTAGGGLLAEAVGVRTGFPFGRYAYAGSLGPEVLDVPAVVPMAWAMFAYPALVAARRLTRRRVALVGGLALASWDLFLDPQMVAAGHWRWEHPYPALPGVAGIPLTNFAGWVLVSVLMMAVLDRLLPRRPGDDAQPAVLFLWTWAGGIVGNLFFFDRPSVALVGGVVMGLVALPYAWSLWAGRP
jgi:uncharacterized membrane protein